MFLISYHVLVTFTPVTLQKAYTESNISEIQKSRVLIDITAFCVPFARMALNGSSYITVSMAIERLIGNYSIKVLMVVNNINLLIRYAFLASTNVIYEIL